MNHLKKENQETLNKLKEILHKNKAILVKFELLYKSFGDVVIEIEYNDAIHRFTSDRGDIYYNGCGIRNSSYHTMGENDTFRTVIEEIEKILFP